MKHVTCKATICVVCNNYFVIRSMLCLLILLCFVETKYLQCCCISKTWLYIFISNRYTLCSEHGNIETKYLQCNVATFLRHDYIYSHFLPSSVGSVDSSEWNGLDINCSSNSQPCRELKWLHFMASSIDVSPLSTSSTLGLLYSAVVPYDSYYACNIWISTCSRKNYILQSIYWHSKSFLLPAYAPRYSMMKHLPQHQL